VSRLAAATLAALLATSARAADVPGQANRFSSPIYGSFEFQFGQYLPNVDSEFKNGATPWKDAFGNSPDWLFQGGAGWAAYHGWGTLELGGRVGYFVKSGFGFLVTGAQSGDQTKFHMIPTAATLTYRVDTLGPGGYTLPLAPYVRLALERYNWWVTDGAGHTTRSGATNGWSAAGGLALLLDLFDPDLARELDQETGINHTYLFAEARKTSVDDFGSSKSWILSDKASPTWAFGILFVF
jgi:hypothetical protein